MKLELHGNETADELIKQLVYVRQLARNIIRRRDRAQVHRNEIMSLQKEAMSDDTGEMIAVCLATVDERLLELRFAEIEIGNYLFPLCDALDKRVSREALFDAINTNRADRETEEVRKYGDKASRLIFVLDLENSATRDDGIEIRPLKWCHTMAFMNAMQTNEKLDRAIHDGANEFFDGAFGEYRERPLMERLAGRAM